MGERIGVLLCDLIESSEVNAKMEGTILLVDKEDWSGMSGGGGTDETHH